MEGTLTPEIWQEVARQTNVPELLKTTRDIPSFGELMDYRILLMQKHNISFNLLKKVAEQISPLDGAREFLDQVRQDFQVVILSDTFYELAMPLMSKLGDPLLLCHKLEIQNDMITGYRLRAEKAKKQAVEAFNQMGFSCIAVGDSYNDIQMFEVSEKAYFINAPQAITAEYPAISCVQSYSELLEELKNFK